MTPLLDVLWGFGLNIVLAYLIPTAIVGSILKIQRKRRAYAAGTEGDAELARDCNRGLVGINALFLLWSWLSFLPQPVATDFILRATAAAFFVWFYWDRPRKVIAAPETILASLTWLAQTFDLILQLVPPYLKLRRALASKIPDELRHYSFSGREISRLSVEQMLLSQTHFTCHSCGLKKENTHLGEILLDENNERLYFCDEMPCRLEARNLYAKKFVSWRKKRGERPS